jgi:hypothetical protein
MGLTNHIFSEWLVELANAGGCTSAIKRSTKRRKRIKGKTRQENGSRKYVNWLF